MFVKEIPRTSLKLRLGDTVRFPSKRIDPIGGWLLLDEEPYFHYLEWTVIKITHKTCVLGNDYRKLN